MYPEFFRSDSTTPTRFFASATLRGSFYNGQINSITYFLTSNATRLVPPPPHETEFGTLPHATPHGLVLSNNSTARGPTRSLSPSLRTCEIGPSDLQSYNLTIYNLTTPNRQRSTKPIDTKAKRNTNATLSGELCMRCVGFPHPFWDTRDAQ